MNAQHLHLRIILGACVYEYNLTVENIRTGGEFEWRKANVRFNVIA